MMQKQASELHEEEIGPMVRNNTWRFHAGNVTWGFEHKLEIAQGTCVFSPQRGGKWNLIGEAYGNYNVDFSVYETAVKEIGNGSTSITDTVLNLFILFHQS